VARLEWRGKEVKRCCQFRAYMFLTSPSGRIGCCLGRRRKPCFCEHFRIAAAEKMAARGTRVASCWPLGKVRPGRLVRAPRVWKMFSFKLQARWHRECYEFQKDGSESRERTEPRR
jgi:hypothetical protein